MWKGRWREDGSKDGKGRKTPLFQTILSKIGYNRWDNAAMTHPQDEMPINLLPGE
jgi:hypothetical protein